MSKENLIIIGAGDLGKQICHYIDNFSLAWKVAGFVDDTMRAGQEILPGIKVLGKIDDLFKLHFQGLLMGIGYNHLKVRQHLFEKLSLKYPFEGFIHPHTYIDKTAKIAKGVFISSGCVIEKDVIIEENVFVYNSVTIAHDAIIRKGSFLAPSVTVAGFSTINECCFVGVGSIISNNISICAHTYLGAGSLVIKNISEPGWYAGTPCDKLSKS